MIPQCNLRVGVNSFQAVGGSDIFGKLEVVTMILSDLVKKRRMLGYFRKFFTPARSGAFSFRVRLCRNAFMCL